MSITVTAGITVAAEGFYTYVAGLLPALQAVIEDYLHRIYDTAYPNVPVGPSGKDRDSLKIVLGVLSGMVVLGEGVNPPYPAYQELGFHHYRTGQFIHNPALIPAFEEHAPAFVAAVTAVVHGKGA